jgi:hypothetical protein
MAAPDFSLLTNAVDYSSVIAAIVAMVAAVAGVYVVRFGVHLILRSIEPPISSGYSMTDEEYQSEFSKLSQESRDWNCVQTWQDFKDLIG